MSFRQEFKLGAHDPSPLAKVHLDRNRKTRGDWDTFGSHRAHVTELLMAATVLQRPTLCILGAGNGNDIGLSQLARCFAEITLVDLDRAALDHCLSQQVANISVPIKTVGGVDLSGILQLLDHLSGQVPRPEQIDELMARAQRPRAPGKLATYAVVASTCLLTQMIDSVASCVGVDHPRFADLVLALRDGHLTLLVDLLAPSGTAVLISDFVSSDTLPELESIPSGGLGPCVSRAINDGNFFTGVNPMVLLHRLRTHPDVDPASVQLHPPWRWQMGNRVYGVCAVVARKRG